MTKVRLTRPARGAVIALLFALVVAAPAAAARPARLVRAPHSGVLAAGTACAFDVYGEPFKGFVAITDFGDGATTVQESGKGQYVNLTTGTTFVVTEAYRQFDRFNSATGIDLGMGSGQFEYTFLPGDLGPFGVVGASGAFYRFVGTASYVWDANANRVTQFTYSGTVTDVCAALS